MAKLTKISLIPALLVLSWAAILPAVSLAGFGDLDHFSWEVGSAQYQAVPFAVTIRAQDNANNLIQNFSGSVSLSTLLDGQMVFADDMENNNAGWSATGLWHLAGEGSSYQNPYSGEASWWYGSEESGNYDVYEPGEQENFGLLKSPEFVVAPGSRLFFRSWEQTEEDAEFDLKEVLLEVGQYTYLLHQCRDRSGSWYQVGPLDLSAYAGRTARLVFSFSTIDESNNSFRGWYVDDISIIGATSSQAVQPSETAAFVNGEWHGDIVLAEPAAALFLLARDAEGHEGKSGEVRVQPLPLSLNLPAAVLEDAAQATGSLNIPLALNRDLAVTLVSGCDSLLTVPSSLTLGAGQTSTSFSMDIVNDQERQGSRQVSITATALNCQAAEGWVELLDDESNDTIFIALPASVSEAGGVLAGAGEIKIQQAVANDTVVQLSASPSGQLLVPASLTIPAGAVSMTFALTVVDDNESNGARTITISAAAPGFIANSAPIEVRDDELHHFSLQPMATPQQVKSLFTVVISARSVDDAILSGYGGALNLTAVSESGAIPLSLTSATLSSGLWQGSLMVLAPATNVTLHVDDGLGHSGVSTPFSVTPGTLDHFSWEISAGVHYSGEAFPVTIRAEDANHFQLPDFTGAVSLSAILGAQPIFQETVENGTNGWSATGLWHLTTSSGAYGERHSGVGSWWYGNESRGDYASYAPGETWTFGVLRSPEFLVGRDSELFFYSWEETEADPAYDLRRISLEVEGQGTILLHACTDGKGRWYRVGPIDLSPWTGKKARLLFSFDSIDAANNGYRGWYVDDVLVTAVQTAPAGLISPEASNGFSKGEWSGTILFHDEAARVTLRAADQAGHSGSSSEFKVISRKAGDLDTDGQVTLLDARLALRILTSSSPIVVQPGLDLNGDGKIGLEEIQFILRKTSGLE